MTRGTDTALATPQAETQALDERTFARFSRLLYDKAGIVLNGNKMALVQARVRKRLRDLDLDSYGAYLKYVEQDDTGRELVQLIDVISTNVTHFFREADHFKVIREAVAGWRAEGRRKLRLWSAASSTGEEPYSLAMTLAAECDISGMDVKILATDISTSVLGTAIKGEYGVGKLRTVPDAYRRRFLTAVDDSNKVFRVNDELREMVVFRRLNLIQRPLPVRTMFDVIMCRNVMIYFDRPTRQGLVKEFQKLLRPGAYMITGQAETMIGIDNEYEFIQPSVHRRRS